MSFLPPKLAAHRSRVALAVIAAALSSVMSFNAAAGLFDDEEARKDIKVLRVQAEQQNRDNDLRMQKLDESIKNIGILQLLNQLEQLNAELARLRGQVEVLTNQNEQLAKRQKDFYLDIDSRLRKLEGVGDAPPSVNAQPTSAPAGIVGLAAPGFNTGAGLANAAPALPSVGLPGSPVGLAEGMSNASNAANAATVTYGIPTSQEPAIQSGPIGVAARPLSSRVTPQSMAPPIYTREQENRAYDVGSNLFRRNDYIGAIRAFETFSKDFPNSQLVANAQYWIGIAYFNLKDFSNARSMQENLLKNYPESSKVPDALLAIASVQQETGDSGSARNTLEDVVARFPGSEAAAKARTRLLQVSRR